MLFTQTKIIGPTARGDVHNASALGLAHLIPQNDTMGFGSTGRGTGQVFPEGIKSTGTL